MNIGVVIPSHGLADKLSRSIEALFKSQINHSISLVVMDNGTDNNSVYKACIDSEFKCGHDFNYCQTVKNNPFAVASNMGVHVLGLYDAYLFLNNDCYIQPDCLQQMMDAMRSGKGDIIGAKLLYPDGTIQHAGGMIEGNWASVSHHCRGYPGDALQASESRKVSWVTGACMLVRAKPFRDMNGFMEVFQNGYEDVDLCLRFAEKRLKTYYCAEAIGIHEEAQTPGRKDHEHDNAMKFFTCWRRKKAEDFR